MRFKTGTPARVDRRSLDFSKMIIQPGDDEVHNFSFMSDVKTREQVPCWLTYTNEQTHKIIRDNIERAPMANGIIRELDRDIALLLKRKSCVSLINSAINYSLNQKV